MTNYTESTIQHYWNKLGANDEANVITYKAQKVAKRFMRNMENVQAEEIKSLSKVEHAILESMSEDKYNAIQKERYTAKRKFDLAMCRTELSQTMLSRRYNKLVKLTQLMDLHYDFMKMVRSNQPINQ